MEDFNLMVKVVRRWIERAHPQFTIEFTNTPRENLVRYHSGLGRDIRNEFKLLERHWVPELVEGVDHSQEHPSQISMRVIEAVWDELHKD